MSEKKIIDIGEIENAIAAAGSTFTIASLQKALGDKSVALRDRLSRLLDSDGEFFTDGANYFSKAAFFAERKFLVTPDEWEIANRVLVIGHRFLPFFAENVFPSEIILADEKTGQALDKKSVTMPLGKAFNYHLLLGSEEIFDFFIAEDPANAWLRSSRAGSENVTFQLFDMAEFYRAKNFTFGDALLVEVVDYSEGKFKYRYLSGESRSAAARKQAVKVFDAALLRVCDKFERYLDIPEQLAQGVFQAGAAAPLERVSLDEYIRESNALEINSDGDHAVLLPAANFASPGDEENSVIPSFISLSGGETGSIGAILKSIGSTYTEVELDSMLRDYCYNRESDAGEFFRRYFGEANFTDEAQEAIFANLIAEKLENMQETYDREADEAKAALRRDVLDFCETRQAFFDRIAAGEIDAGKLDHQLLTDCAGLSGKIDHLLGAVEADRAGAVADLEDELGALLDRADAILEKLTPETI